MAFNIVSEKYNGLPALYANTGKWVSAEIKVENTFYAGSGYSYQFTIDGNVLSRPDGDWGDYGFVSGDTVTLTFTDFSNNSNHTYTRTITYVNGPLMYLDSAFPSPYGGPISFGTQNEFSGLAVNIDKIPEQIDLYFNLVLNGTQSVQSVIDTEVNRLSAETVGMNVGDTVSMVQLGYKSGGIIKNAQITRTANSGTKKCFTITFKFNMWGLFQDGNNPPDWFAGADYLSPYIEAKSYALIGNPNGMQTGKNGALDGNTGYFDENYNGATSNYVPTGISFMDALGNPIDKPNYAGVTNFVATINAPNQSNGNSNYRIGMFFAPVNDLFFKNRPETHDSNIMLNAPDQDFQHSTTPDPTVYTGEANYAGAEFDFKDLQFTHAAGVLTVSGQIQANNAANTFFSQIPDGERRMIIFVQVSNYLLTGTQNDEVNVRIYDGDNYEAPVLGVQYPDIVSETLFDHAGNDITSASVANTTTDDDVLYVNQLLLEEGTEYDGIRMSISARNDITGETFTLEEFFFDFENQPFIAGIHEVNMSMPRNFKLPPSSDRNAISVVRDQSIDTAGKYGIAINYGFVNNWRYWIEQANVDDYFFDSSQPFNGKNKNWQRFWNGDWNTYVDVYVRKNGVDDFNHYLFKIRPYEDDPNVSVSTTIIAPNGSTPSNFPSNSLCKLETTIDWNQAFDSEWVEIFAEGHEGTLIGYISSYLNHDSQPLNPFSPISGETKLKVTNNGNSLFCECMFDTSLVSVNDIDLSVRVFSLPKGTVGFPIVYPKDSSGAWSVMKVSPDSLYSGPCLRVYRTDTSELDVGFVNGVVDKDAIDAFSLGGDVWVKTIYDQSGTGHYLQQNDPAKMALIATSGLTITDPDNGLPSMFFDGIDDHYRMNGSIYTTTKMAAFWVLRRGASTVDSISLSATTTSYVMSWGLSGSDIKVAVPTEIVITSDISTGAILLSMTRDDNSDISVFKMATQIGSIYNDPNTNAPMTLFGLSGTVFNSGLFQEYLHFEHEVDMAAMHQNIIDRYGL